MIKAISPNRAVAFAVFAPILYYILTLFFSVRVLSNTFNSLSLGVAVVISATYLFSFIEAIRHNASSRPWKLIIAITVLWMTVLAQGIYVAFWGYYGRPDSWSEGVVPGYWRYSYFIAGCFFLLASTEEKEGFVPSFWPLMLAVAIGSMIVGIVLGLGIQLF